MLILRFFFFQKAKDKLNNALTLGFTYSICVSAGNLTKQAGLCHEIHTLDLVHFVSHCFRTGLEAGKLILDRLFGADSSESTARSTPVTCCLIHRDFPN